MKNDKYTMIKTLYSDRGEEYMTKEYKSHRGTAHNIIHTIIKWCVRKEELYHFEYDLKHVD